MAVAAVSGRIHTVKEVHTALHRLQNVLRRPDAHQVSRLFARQLRHHGVQNAVHLLGALADRQAADRIAVEIQFAYLSRVTYAHILENTALVDAEQELLRIHAVRLSIEPRHFRFAAL